MEQNGQKLALFGEIVRASIVLLESLIAKAMQKLIWQFTGKTAGVKAFRTYEKKGIS